MPTIDDLEQEIQSLKETVQQLLVQQNNQQKELAAEEAERALAIPIGGVVAFAGESVPARYLLCDGSPLKQSEFPELFAAIHTAHGNGVNEVGVKLPDHEFNLPDYRGYFLRGVDAAGLRDQDVTARTAPKSGGHDKGNVGSVQSDTTRMPRQARFSADPNGKHSHTVGIKFLELKAGVNATIGFMLGGGSTGTSEEHDHPHAISGGDAETRPQNVYVHYIIKAK